MAFLAMSPNGRVLIPAALREQLGFKPHERIFVEVREGSLVLTPAERRYANIRTFFDTHLTHLTRLTPTAPGRDSVDEFIAERREEAAREYAK
jgi:AbrB family looped-hinge helix DNA binding protein